MQTSNNASREASAYFCVIDRKSLEIADLIAAVRDRLYTEQIPAFEVWRNSDCDMLVIGQIFGETDDAPSELLEAFCADEKSVLLIASAFKTAATLSLLARTRRIIFHVLIPDRAKRALVEGMIKEAYKAEAST